MNVYEAQADREFRFRVTRFDARSATHVVSTNEGKVVSIARVPWVEASPDPETVEGWDVVARHRIEEFRRGWILAERP